MYVYARMYVTKNEAVQFSEKGCITAHSKTRRCVFMYGICTILLRQRRTLVGNSGEVPRGRKVDDNAPQWGGGGEMEHRVLSISENLAQKRLHQLWQSCNGLSP